MDAFFESLGGTQGNEEWGADALDKALYSRQTRKWFIYIQIHGYEWPVRSCIVQGSAQSVT